MEALLYPQTYLREDLAQMALQVVSRLVLLRPAEYPPEGVASKLARESKVRYLYLPPLGEKLSVFLDLVQGYEEWGYMLRTPENVALFKGFPEPLEESVSDIKKALLGKDEPQEDPLLTARILLALAERLDARLENLDRELQNLEEKTRFLSRMILGEDPSPSRFPRWVVEPREPHWKLPALAERMQAWRRLATLLTDFPSTLLLDQPEIIEEWADYPLQKISEESFEGFRLHTFRVSLSLPDLLRDGEKSSSGETHLLFLERL